jgi:hypothetical protein
MRMSPAISFLADGGRLAALAIACGAIAANSALADAITDWDAVAASSSPPGAYGQREQAIVDLAMYDAVDSIVRAYPPFLALEDGFAAASPEAAAGSAAATVLAQLRPDAAIAIQAALDNYLKGLAAAPEALASGRQLGTRVAKRILEARAADGATGTDPYRPHTLPGMYVPTATMIGATWPGMRPFVLERADQFRPGPPIALATREWAADYNEVKVLGERNSTQRTPVQTETAKFWLMTGPQAYHPLARQFVMAHHMKLVDSARFMAVYSTALADAYIAVFDAKYHYEFWRPITAIRNGDIDGNPDTNLDPAWQPLDATPMHPEYPCAHCVASGAATAVIEAFGGLRDMPDLHLASATAPGVMHRWHTLEDFTSEVANARIWAGFHFRFSARVGTQLGHEVGGYVASHFAIAGDPKPVAR